MRTIAVVLLASCAVSLLSLEARADEPAPGGSSTMSPKDHFDRGMVFYNVQDWPSAVRELRLAYEGDQKAEYLYSLAQAQRMSGDCASAILTYRAFMRQSTGKAEAAAEGFVHVCEAQVRSQQEAAAQKVAAVPVPAAGAAAPPPPAPPPPPPPAPTRNTTWIADPLGDTLLVLGLGGAAVGTVFFLQANSNSSAATSGAKDSTWSSDSSTAKTDSIIGVVGVSAGGVLLAGAIWRYVVVGSRSKEKSPPPSVGFAFGHGGLQVSYGATF